jgi:glyoxylase-like metal-dependent hydrolase (beta-lactamase superfamily II)
VSVVAGKWTEIGDRVFVRRYRLFDQNIVAILGDGETLVVDTRSSHRQAAELQADLRSLAAQSVTVVVSTHGHSDHVFGNHAFRPCVIWGHDRCVTMMQVTGERQRAALIANQPELADELAEVVLDPPDHTFTESATVEFGGRMVDLRYLGRGHTDNDTVLVAADADVVCVGDLLENGATPYFGDGFPMDWPATAEALLGLIGEQTVVVPGHGDHAGRDFAASSQRAFSELAALARRVHSGEVDLAAALESAPYPVSTAREPLTRALAQLRGELEG